MNKNEAEQVIRDMIEYANKEIERNKRKSLRNVVIVICSLLVMAVVSLCFFRLEMSVKYTPGLLLVNVPEDQGLDITVNLKNYSSAKGVLVKQENDTYDLYIGLTQTPYTELTQGQGTLIRAGSGIVVDYNSDRVIQYLPGKTDGDKIIHVYYIDHFTAEIMNMDDSELEQYENKTLVWTR